MDSLENKLDELLVKKAPFQIPENGRKTIANIMPWLVIVASVLYALAVLSFYNAYHAVSNLVDYANAVSRAYGGPGVASGLTTFGWVWIAASAAQVALMALALPGLFAKKRSGWKMLFYAELLSVVVAIVSLLRGYSIISGFVMGLVFTVVGFYILFQIRGQYSGAGSVAAKPAAAPEKKEEK